MTTYVPGIATTVSTVRYHNTEVNFTKVLALVNLIVWREKDKQIDLLYHV